MNGLECVRLSGWQVAGGDIWRTRDLKASPTLFIIDFIDCSRLNWLYALKKEGTDNGEHWSISTMRHVSVEIRRKLIQAVKQLVIFVLPDSMMNCHRGHLDHLSCLGKPHLITVRESRDGQQLLYRRETYHLLFSLSVFLSLTQTHTHLCQSGCVADLRWKLSWK